MLYIDSILRNNESHQKIAIVKLIDSSRKLNMSIPNEYYQELEKLNKKTFSPLSEVSVLSGNTDIIVNNMYSQNNQIVIDTSRNLRKKDISVSHWNTNNRYRQIYDIKGVLSKKSIKQIRISKNYIVKIAQYKPNIVRIVFNDKKKIKTSFSVYRNKVFISYKINRYTSAKSQKKDKEQSQAKQSTKRSSSKRQTSTLVKKSALNSVIVIDPGHGGKDPGAIGYKKYMEKKIVLGISRLVYKNLKKRGYKKVYLTRNKDKFISLQKRTKFANKKKADIFISIHANAVKSTRTKGIETYFLSPARSSRAKKIAAKENKEAIRSLNFSSKNIFLNVLNKSRLVASNKLAIDVHKNMKFRVKQKMKSVSDHGVRSGPFWVLVGAQMPSILVEVGYVTNKGEAKRLYSKKYQELLALGIVDGISSYLTKNK